VDLPPVDRMAARSARDKRLEIIVRVDPDEVVAQADIIAAALDESGQAADRRIAVLARELACIVDDDDVIPDPVAQDRIELAEDRRVLGAAGGADSGVMRVEPEQRRLDEPALFWQRDDLRSRPDRRRLQSPMPS